LDSCIIISQVLKSAITICVIGNLPLLFCFPLTLALFYVWSVVRPTCRCRIFVWARIAPVREDKEHVVVLLCRPRSSLAFFPLLCRTPTPPSILLPSSLRPNANPISFRGEPGVSGGGESRRGWRRRLEVVATKTNPNLHISPPTLAPPAIAADEWKPG